MSSRPVPREETLNRRALSSSMAIEGGEVENETLHGWRIVAYKVWRRQLLTLLLLLSLSLSPLLACVIFENHRVHKSCVSKTFAPPSRVGQTTPEADEPR